jgi:hypothetical protein
VEKLGTTLSLFTWGLGFSLKVGAPGGGAVCSTWGVGLSLKVGSKQKRRPLTAVRRPALEKKVSVPTVLTSSEYKSCVATEPSAKPPWLMLW